MVFSTDLPRLSLALALSALVTAQPALAQEVTLKGIDSPLNITGTLLSASDGRFVVRTIIGEFDIEQSQVTCEGDACPQVREIENDLHLGGGGDVGEALIPILTEGFASTLDAETVLLDSFGNPLKEAVAEFGESGEMKIEIVDYEGEVLANFGIIEVDGQEAYEALVSGEAPIIFTDVPASRKERDFVKDAGVGDLTTAEQNQVIAVAGLAVVVNPKNTIGAVTIEQVADIFAGKITDWAELGGQPGPINLYSYDTESGKFHTISELLLEPLDYTLSPDANIVRNTSELTAAITRDEAGFGLVDFNSRRGTRPLPLINECDMTFYVSPFNIKTEEYPLSYRVHNYSRPDLEGFARDFQDYLYGPDLDGLVSKAGLVDLSVATEIQVDAAERVAVAAAQATDTYERGFMETLMQRQNQYERLSTTFRFAPGSNELDVKSMRDLSRMASYLTVRQPAEVLVVGFTDNKGSFDANLLVAEERANQVVDHIRNHAVEMQEGIDIAGIEFVAMGFGQLSPAACNSTPRGRATNRRVEIWVR